MEGLVLCPPPPLSSLQQLDMTATSSPKSCLPVFSVSLSVSAVRSGSGGLAGAQHDRKARLVDRGPGVCVWDLIGKFSQQKGRDEGPACMRGPPWVSPHRKKKKGEKKSYWPWFTRQEEKKKKTTNGGGDMQHTRAHRVSSSPPPPPPSSSPSSSSSAAAAALDALGWIFGLGMKPLSVSVVSKSCNPPPPPPLLSLPPSTTPLQTPPPFFFAYMDDLSDKGNRFQHFVIRPRKNLQLKWGGPCIRQPGRGGRRNGKWWDFGVKNQGN